MTTVHLAVGRWYGSLCDLGRASAMTADDSRHTLLRERVTCGRCLVVLDRLEERGWPVAGKRVWVESYARQADGEWREAAWFTSAPTTARRRRIKAQGHALALVKVLNVASLRHHADALFQGP